MENDGLKLIIEAMLFASERPLTIDTMRAVLETVDPSVIEQCIEGLNTEYAASGRSFTIDAIAGGYQLVTHPKFAPYLKKLFQRSKLDRMTRPTLETLAIIAYSQPVTRAEIEQIRGVNSDGVVKTLLEKNLIKIAGRKDAIGRPFTYSTTEEFLELFGLGSLKDLPQLQKTEDVSALTLPEELRPSPEAAEYLAAVEARSEEGGGNEPVRSQEES